MPLTQQPAIGSLTLTTLRRGRGLEQEDLALMSGRPRTQISAWETSDEPGWPVLVALCVDCMKYSVEEVEALADCLSRIQGLTGRDGPLPRIPPSPIPVNEPELREIRRLSASLGRTAMDAHAAQLINELRAFKVRQAREAAEALCQAYLALPREGRHFDLGTVDAAHVWTVAERLAELSTKAAARSWQEALAIARLACRVARKAPGDRLWQARLFGFCLAFVANAWRVAGRLRKADRIFRRAEALWHQGEDGDPDRLLAPWRLIDLKASLRRATRDFPAALALLDQAKETAPQACWGRILINRAAVFDAMFEADQVLQVLREAAPLLDAGNDSSLRTYARLLECGSLCRLSRFMEAEELLCSTRTEVIAQGNRLDLIRLRWLSGLVEAGRGRTQEALESFHAVRRHFYEEKMAYDFALASLEEAELRLSLGQDEQVRRMVLRDMLWVFAAEGIHREGLAALELFREAVESGEVTTELIRRIHDYLERAEHNPSLRFER